MTNSAAPLLQDEKLLTNFQSVILAPNEKGPLTSISQNVSKLSGYDATSQMLGVQSQFGNQSSLVEEQGFMPQKNLNIINRAKTPDMVSSPKMMLAKTQNQGDKSQNLQRIARNMRVKLIQTSNLNDQSGTDLAFASKDGMS